MTLIRPYRKSKRRHWLRGQEFHKQQIKALPRWWQNIIFLQANLLLICKFWEYLINPLKECSSTSSVSCGSWDGRWKCIQQVVTGLHAWAYALFMWCPQPKSASCQDANLKSCCWNRSSCLSPTGIASPLHHSSSWRVSCETSCVLPAIPLNWDWCLLTCNSRTQSEMWLCLQSLHKKWSFRRPIYAHVYAIRTGERRKWAWWTSFIYSGPFSSLPHVSGLWI